MVYRPAQLPRDFDPVEASVSQVMAYRNESARKVFDKMRAGIYRSYRNGKSRVILFDSVKADRECQIAAGPQFALDLPGVKRRPGRPKKPK